MKRIPGPRYRCRDCKQPIVWAKTMRTESGRGGKNMPLDPDPNPEGNVAVRPAHGGQLLCRVLLKDEDHDHQVEVRAMPHAATCFNRPGKDIAAQAEAYLRSQVGANQ